MLVSSYVRPPIVVSDVSRPKPMTVRWSSYAQSLTSRPMKGMLTGPVTILNWSFPRADVSRELQCKQLALALRDEVVDLEKAGIKAVQVDEPALREGVCIFIRSYQPSADIATFSFPSARLTGRRTSTGLSPRSSWPPLVLPMRSRLTRTFATPTSTTSSRPSRRSMPMSFRSKRRRAT